MILLTLNQQEEKVIDKVISAIADCIQIEPMQVASVITLLQTKKGSNALSSSYKLTPFYFNNCYFFIINYLHVVHAFQYIQYLHSIIHITAKITRNTQ